MRVEDLLLVAYFVVYLLVSVLCVVLSVVCGVFCVMSQLAEIVPRKKRERANRFHISLSCNSGVALKGGTTVCCFFLFQAKQASSQNARLGYFQNEHKFDIHSMVCTSFQKLL